MSYSLEDVGGTFAGTSWRFGNVDPQDGYFDDLDSLEFNFHTANGYACYEMVFDSGNSGLESISYNAYDKIDPSGDDVYLAAGETVGSNFVWADGLDSIIIDDNSGDSILPGLLEALGAVQIGASNTAFANRYGIDLTLTQVDLHSQHRIPFANTVSVEISGDAVFATGYQAHRRVVGFQNPLEGTLTISTQLVTPELIYVLSGAETSSGAGEGAAAGAVKKFRSRTDVTNYVIEGATIWKDADGVMHAEDFIAPKAKIRPEFSVTYSGDGDPQSIDITFDLLEDKNRGLLQTIFV